MRLFLCFLCLFHSSAALIENAHAAPSPWGKKEFGILLVTPDQGVDFNGTLRALKKSLGSKIPFETLTGSFGPREVQKAVYRLEAAHVSKIVTIPLTLYPQSSSIEQLRYLLGIQENPSRTFMENGRMPHRVIPRTKIKIPVVIGHAIGPDPAVASILTEHAASMSRNPKKEVVILVGFGSPKDEENIIRKKTIDTLASQIKEAGRYQEAQAFLLRPSNKDKPKLEQESERRLRQAIKGFSVKNRVLLIPLLLTHDGSARTLKKRLDGLFYRWKGEALLPNERMTGWIVSQAKELSTQKDMVQYKDKGRTLPPKERKRNVK